MPESPRPCQYPREQFLTTNDGKPTTSRDNLVPWVTVLSHNELISFSLHLPWLHFIRCTSLHSHGIVLHSIKNAKTYPVGQPFRDLKTVAAHAGICKPWNTVSVTSPSLVSASNIYLSVSSGSDSNTPEMIAISCYNLPLHIQTNNHMPYFENPHANNHHNNNSSQHLLSIDLHTRYCKFY